MINFKGTSRGVPAERASGLCHVWPVSEVSELSNEIRKRLKLSPEPSRNSWHSTERRGGISMKFNGRLSVILTVWLSSAGAWGDTPTVIPPQPAVPSSPGALPPAPLPDSEPNGGATLSPIPENGFLPAPATPSVPPLGTPLPGTSSYGVLGEGTRGAGPAAGIGPFWAPGGYEPRIGSPYYYHAPGGGEYVVTGNPYYDHFGPGFQRHSLHGHYRFPYYTYRAPWYYPGRAVYNRDTNHPW